MTEASTQLVYVRYLDHVLFSQCSALTMQPQVRETVGWLIYEGEDYITVSWDRDAGPATLKAGDPKETGLVILKKLILEKKNFE